MTTDSDFVDRLEDAIFGLAVDDDTAFESLRLEVEAYQRSRVPFYERYCARVGMSPAYVPTEAFGLTRLATFPESDQEAVFLSSGTGSERRSTHHVRRLSTYARSVTVGFERRFGRGPYRIVPCLPSGPAVSGQSSLVTMAGILIDYVGDEGSGFPVDPTDPREVEALAAASGYPVILFATAFGLLDLVEAGVALELSERDIVVETGGMKTHRREMGRSALHDRVSAALHIQRSQVWSEYGMCELFSQAWAHGDGKYSFPPWVRFDVVDPADPASSCPVDTEGRLAVIDLANVHTISTILTGDRAIRRQDGFEIPGRMTAAGLRGCNFLVEAAERESTRGTA